MSELVEVIAKALVTKPDEVSVSEEKEAGTTVVTLRVAAEDMGKIIGKLGRIAKALSTVVKATSVKTGEKVVVEIVQ